MQNKYTPETLPYHLVVPSLIGYAYSSGPPTNKDWDTEDTSRVMHSALMELGFEGGFVTQGGDIGAGVSLVLATKYDTCKACHLNYVPVLPSKDMSMEGVSQMEMAGLARAQAWLKSGSAYAQEHGTRPGTIGLVLSSSPLALLTWIGEKYLEWTDEDPSTEEILRTVSLYWLTDTFPRAIYPYRAYFGSKAQANKLPDDLQSYCEKPMGYSYFPKDLLPTPVVWAKTKGNLVWSRQHDKVSSAYQISESIANARTGWSFCRYGAACRFRARHRRFRAASLV
jgi:microsomal epoxide hydrolase